MTYALEVDHQRLEAQFEAVRTFSFWRETKFVTPSGFAPVLRSSKTPLLGRYELALLRYGLVPPSFTSAKEADRYGLHAVRAKRVQFQRDVSAIAGAGQRCLVPMTVSGELIAAAGLWSRWTRKRQGQELRVESFAVLTVEGADLEYHPMIVDAWDWNSWLDETLSLESLANLPPMQLERRSTPRPELALG